MQNHIKLLIAGGIIIGSSIGLFFLAYGLFGMPTANTPLKISPVTPDLPINLVISLNEGKETTIYAKDILSRDISLNAKIIDSSGIIVQNYNFKDKLLTTFIPPNSGTYEFVVLPIDGDRTTVEAAIGDAAVVKRFDTAQKAGDVLGPEFELYGYAGLGIFVGVIIILIGAIKFAIFTVKSRRAITKK